MLHNDNKKSMLLVFLGFASGTNNVLLSLSNRDNTLGMLVSLGFASGTTQLPWVISLNYTYRPCLLSFKKIFRGVLMA